MRLKPLFALTALFLSLAFAASARTVTSDFNGDGKSDLVLQNASTGAVAIWLMNDGNATSLGMITPPDRNWEVVATGDLDGDGKADIVAHNRVTDAVAFWKMNGTSRTSEVTIATPKQKGWRVIGARDLNADGKADLILQNSLTGALATWQMDGGKLVAGHPYGRSDDCAIALGNFGGDALVLYSPADKVLRRKFTAADGNAELLDRGAVTGAVVAGDFNGDGKDDIVEQSASDSLRMISFGATGNAATIRVPAGWKLIGAGDYNGDGNSEALLASANSIAAWELKNGTLSQRWTIPVESGWSPLAVSLNCPTADMHAGHAATTAAAPMTKAAPYAAQGTNVTFPSASGNAMGYLSLPKGAGKKPALIVIQEWWGVNDWIRQQTDRFASQGYVTIAVDLYRGRSTTSQEEAHELSRGLPQDRAVADLKSAFNYLAARGDVDPKRIGSIGWCLGGGYSLQLALAEPRLAACVINYGALATDPATIAKIHAPILGNFGALDRGISVTDVNAFDAALKAAGKSADIKIYDGAGHGFMNPNNTAGYVAAAAEDAWKRIDAFLAKRLGRS